jgi:predicted PurR-regulated permease PerM
MTAAIAALKATDYAVIVIAAFFALAVIVVSILVLNLFRVVSSLKELVDGVTQETVPLIHEVGNTVKGVNHEIERVDSIMASAQTVAHNVETISHTVKAAVTNPLVKALAFFAGARRATSKLKEKD